MGRSAWCSAASPFFMPKAGRGRELHLDLNLLRFNLNQRSPAKEGADSECLGVGALFVGSTCHPAGLSLLLSCLLHALGLSFCPAFPHAPLGPCTCDLSLFGFLQQGLAETTSMLKAAPGSAQHVSWKPLGAGGQEMAGAASHRHRMVCLDRRHAEITFPAAVPVPGTGVPDPTGCQSPFSWGSRSLGHTSAFPGGSFQPGRGFCAGCPTRESCFFPK